VLHISVEMAQHSPHVGKRDIFWTLTSADMQEAEPPTTGGRGR
jgi:hypothetical protein